MGRPPSIASTQTDMAEEIVLIQWEWVAQAMTEEALPRELLLANQVPRVSDTDGDPSPPL